MFVPRTVRTSRAWPADDGIKLYTISTSAEPVAQEVFRARLATVKAARAVCWSATPHFAIFHQGAACHYLILAWWANDNELFNSVSVLAGDGWVEDPSRYSFCLYDLEVFWDERNSYIATIDCARPDIAGYRERRRSDWLV